MEHNAKLTRVQNEWVHKNLPQEWSAEIVLPDYRSEISRLLWVRPVFSVPARFIGNGRVDFSGTVRYRILYVGPDGRLYGVEEETPYEFSLPLDGGGEEPVLWAELVPDGVVSRVAAPRRLSVRCRLHARVRGYAAADLAPAFSGAEASEPLCLWGEETGMRVFRETGDTMELTGMISVDGGEDLRVITADGAAFFSEVMAVAGAVRCKGEVNCAVLCVREGEGEESVPFVLNKKLPFEETVPTDGVTETCEALALGTVEIVTAAVEDGGIRLSVCLVPEVEARRGESLSFVKDVFLPGRVTDPHGITEHFKRHERCTNKNISFGGEVTREDVGVPAEAEILLAFAHTEEKEEKAENGRTVLTGEVCFDLIYIKGREYGVSEGKVPYRLVLEDASPARDITLCVPICRVTADREKLRVDGEIQLAYRGFAPFEFKRIASAEFSPARAHTRAGMEICYPQAGDTLWTLSKRYDVSPELLALCNGISGECSDGTDVLAGVKYLLLP